MCGRFDTTKLTWREIHDQLSVFHRVTTPPQKLQPNDDVRPTQEQLVARVEDDGWVLDKMRWGLVPFWRNGKPLKDTENGRDDGFKLSTFNARVESCHRASTFREAFAKRRCIVRRAPGMSAPATRTPRSSTPSPAATAERPALPAYGAGLPHRTSATSAALPS
jgi:putative SOS response-associated peptidase YedK